MSSIATRRTSGIVDFESTFSRIADRAMKRKAALAIVKPAAAPPKPGRWATYRLNHGAIWKTYRQMSELGGTSVTAARFQVNHHSEFYEKRIGKVSTMIRVKAQS